jgi:hypothetical protein
MSSDGIPHLQVTMVGNTGSGKTTYLIGMYAEMSNGVDNYFLTSHQDTHVDLTDAWARLVEDGLLPTATDESKSFSFMFRYGTAPLLSMEWIDYRGSDVRGKSDNPTTAALLERLGESDSLYFTFDGALLASVLAGETGAERKFRETTGLYNNMLVEVLDKRNAANLIPPSIVLLVTKSDLLIDQLSGDARERRCKIVDWISGRFGQAFAPDRDVAVCIVSLGELGDDPVERVEARLVDPIQVHKPMVFTLFSFYRRAAMLFEAHGQQMREQGYREARELENLRAASFSRVLGRKKAKELEEAARNSAQTMEALEELAGGCWDRVRVLEGELLDIDTFVGGQRLGAA